MGTRPGDTTSLVSQNTISSQGGRSIYPKGPQFSIDTFQSKDFIVKDFIESLSDGQFHASRRSGSYSQAFDPKPYIRTFEHALSRLATLSDEREAHENELAGAVRRAEAQHRQHCATLQRKLDQALESFNTLETRLDSTADGTGGPGTLAGSGGNVALQIGERLEELDKQRKHADAAKYLIECWADVSERGDLSRLEDTRVLGGGEGKVRCAQVARQLLKISNRLGSSASAPTNGLNIVVNGDAGPNGDKRATDHERRNETNEIIERFLERLEKDLLEQFDECNRQHNEGGMRECATALYDFGEGASVIARFVNQHEFFLDKSHMVTEDVSGDPETWDRLADPDAEPSGIESNLLSLLEEVKLVLQEESFTIKQIFPFHEQVMIKFLQRIFQQSIQQRLENVLEKATSVSSLAFLRTLQTARSYVGTMVEDLKLHGLTEHPDTISPQVAATLEQQVEDLFIPYVSGSAYIDRERRSIEELYTSLLFRFTLYHSKRRSTPSTYLGTLSQRGKELLSVAMNKYIERLDSSDLPASQKATLMRIAGIKDSDIEAKNKVDVKVSEEDGALSVHTAKRMLKWLAEAVGRSLEVSGGSETPKDVSNLQKLLFAHTIELYLDTALDTAAETASAQENARNEPDLSFIPDVRAAVTILQLTATISNSVLVPLASANVTVRRDMEKSAHAMVMRMEEKISGIRTRTIDVALNWVGKLLAKQARTDFRPKDDGLAIDQLQTPTCSSVFAFLTRVRDLCLKTVEGRNLETFFTELAVGFRSLLFDHFKKFQVNLSGGLMVSKDITKYIELLRTFPLATSFLPSLEILVEVGNIFVIGPEALKDRLRGGSSLTGVDKGDLRPYILRREDSGSVGVQSVLNAL